MASHLLALGLLPGLPPNAALAGKAPSETSHIIELSDGDVADSPDSKARPIDLTLLSPIHMDPTHITAKCRRLSVSSNSDIEVGEVIVQSPSRKP